MKLLEDTKRHEVARFSFSLAVVVLLLMLGWVIGRYAGVETVAQQQPQEYAYTCTTTTIRDNDFSLGLKGIITSGTTTIHTEIEEVTHEDPNALGGSHNA